MKTSADVIKYLNETANLTKTHIDDGFLTPVMEFGTKLNEAWTKKVEERNQAIKAKKEELDELERLDAAGQLPKLFNGKPVPNKKERARLMDSYSNEALLIGSRDDVWASSDTYSLFDNLHNWQLWLALYMSSWVFRKIIDQQAADIATHGIKITMPSDYIESTVVRREGNKIIRTRKRTPRVSSDQMANIYENYESAVPSLITFTAWGKLFGGAIACMLISGEDPKEYYKPLGEVKGTIRLHVVDRWNGVMPSMEKVSDPGNPDYGTPKYYDVSLTNGSIYRFHHTRVLRYINKQAPKIISDTLNGWGIPEGLHLFQELNRDEKMKNMITSLLNKYNLEIIKMSGMRAFMNGQLSPESEAQLDARLELINRYRSFNSLVFLDSDDEYIRQDGSSMAGLADLLEKNKSLVSGAASMPMVLVYGDQQKGLSGNSFDDMQLYDQRIQGEKNGEYKIQIHKLLVAIAKAQGVQDLKSLKFSFNSIIPPIEKDVIQNSRDILDVYKTLKEMGLYDNEMIVRELKSKGDSIIFGSELNDENVEEIIEEQEEEEAAEEAQETETPNLPSTEELNEAINTDLNEEV